MPETNLTLEDLLHIRDVLDANHIPIPDILRVTYSNQLQEKLMANEGTPASRAGFKEGSLGVDNESGDIFMLLRDDSSACPMWRNTSTGSQFYYYVSDLEPIDEPKDWLEREHIRFRHGRYKPMPLSVYELMEEYDWQPPYEHFIHIGAGDKSKIAYTEGEAKGEADRQTVTTLGRYLKKYSHFTDPQIAKVANQYRKEVIGGQELKFAQSRETIKYVYENGPSSCMSKDAGYYMTSGIHPAEIYATPDCSVAYIERTDSDGTRITARAVLNEVAKEYSRIYGDYDTMEALLSDHGYTEGGLNGCTFLLLRNSNNDIIAPYLDGDCNMVTVASNHLLCDYDGDHEAQQESGLLDSARCCEHCGEPMRGEEYYSDWHSVTFGECCADEYTYTHTRWGTDYVRMDTVELYEYSGEWYTVAGAEEHNLVLINDELHSVDDVIYSELDEEWYTMDDPDVVAYESSNGETLFTVTNADELVEAADTGKTYHIDDLNVVEVNGSFIYYFKDLPEELNAA